MGGAHPGKLDFRSEQGAFGIQHIHIGGVTVVVAQARQPCGRAQTVHGGLQGVDHMRGAILNSQRIAHVPERLLHGQNICGCGLTPGRFAGLDVAGDAPEGEDGQADVSGKAPELGCLVEELIKFGTLGSELAGQGNGRKPGITSSPRRLTSPRRWIFKAAQTSTYSSIL